MLGLELCPGSPERLGDQLDPELIGGRPNVNMQGVRSADVSFLPRRI